MVAQLGEMLQALPDRLPPAHIRLMNANRDRIFAALRDTATGAN